MTVEKTNVAVIYKEVLPKTDIEYILNSVNLKENIILNEKPEDNAEYKFKIETELNGILNEDKSVSFYDEKGNEILKIDSPYMMDSNNQYSEEINVSLEKEDSYYKYIITPDNEWLSAKDRAYPVKIDPPLSATGYDTIKDVTGVFHSSVGNLGTVGESAYLKVGNRYDPVVGGVKEVQSMIYSPLPTAITSAAQTRIISAKLCIVGYRQGITSCPNGIQINAYGITSDWNTSNINENNPIALGANGRADYGNVLDYVEINDAVQTEFDGKVISFDITEMAERWHAGYSRNYGIALRGANLGSSENVARFFDSSNQQLSVCCPQFIYCYRDTKGVEDYWSFTTVTSGRYGATGVNNFNGNAVITQPLVSDTGSMMPVSLSLIYSYNSRLSNDEAGFGAWRTNYYMQVDSCNLSFGDYSYPYRLNDSDGTSHYFVNRNNEIVDEDGLGLKLIVNSNTSIYKYTMEDKNKVKYHFNINGYLLRIIDAHGNYNDISYVPGTCKIQNITEGNINLDSSVRRTTTVTYGSDTVTVTSGVSGDTATVHFLNSTNKLVTGVSYEETSWVSYEYSTADNTYYPVRINDGYGHKVSMTYGQTGYAKRISSLSYGTETETLERYIFNYGHNYTDVIDIDGKIITYQFNNYGHTVAVVNKGTSQSQNYEYGLQERTGTGILTGEENKVLEESKVITYSENRITNGTIMTANAINEYIAQSGITKVSNYGFSNSAPYSMVLTKTNENTNGSYVYQDITSDITAGVYTLSMYVSTRGTELTGNGVSATVDISNRNGWRAGASSVRLKHTEENEWVRLQVSVNVLDGDTSLRCELRYEGNTTGTVYVDDIQLEKNLSGGNQTRGDNLAGAGSYNLLKNASLINGTNEWSINGFARNTYQSSDRPNTVKYVLSTEGNVSSAKTIGQSVHIEGHKDDVIIGGAWVKVNSVSIYDNENKNNAPRAGIYVTFFDSSFNRVGTTAKIDCNTDIDGWQYLSLKAVAEGDYSYVQYMFNYSYNTGEAVFSCPFLYKENYGASYTYDMDGNLVSSRDNAEAGKTFAYDNNSLTAFVSPTGSSYIYTRKDSNNDIESAMSNAGQKVTYQYDSVGNVTSVTLSDAEIKTEITGESVYLVNAKTGRSIGIYGDSNGSYVYVANNRGYTRQKLQVENSAGDIYYIKVISNGLYLKTTTDGISHTGSTTFGTQNTKFKLLRNDDGTFRILTGESNYTEALMESEAKYENDYHKLTTEEYDEKNLSQRWYLVDTDVTETMTSSAVITNDKRNVSESTDEMGNTSYYTYSNGDMITKTDPLGNETEYTYDNMHRVTSMTRTIGEEELSANYTYTNGKLSEIEYEGTEYTFQYDTFGRKISTGINGNILASYTYTGRNLTSQTYGNGSEISYLYDSIDRITEKRYNGDTIVKYSYDPNGNVFWISDYLSQTKTINEYDLSGRITNISKTSLNGQIPVLSQSIRYNDKKGTVKSISESIYDTDGNLENTLNYTYTYGELIHGQIPDTIYEVNVGGTSVNMTYDKLGRVSNKEVTLGENTRDEGYTYLDNGNGTTTSLVESMTDLMGNTRIYSYDANGNIIREDYEESEGYSLTIRYEYDELGRLVRADNPFDYETEIYTYDKRGNLLERRHHSYSEDGEIYGNGYAESFEYGGEGAISEDCLTSYMGNTITYDEIGNPLNWGIGRSNIQFSWTNGRSLSRVTRRGTTIAEYTYNADGLRVTKSGINNSEYYISEGKYLGERRTISGTEYYISYIYTDGDSPSGLYVKGGEYTGNTYWFVKNLQGDVTGIIDESGAVVTEYYYTPFGDNYSSVNNATATHISKLNPFRYRGYMYDSETGYYYLRTRYYDPVVGRFLNADGFVSTGTGLLGMNIYIYCNCNPINSVDYDGMCFYNIRGEWCHDNWEYIGNYVRKPDKNIKIGTINSGKLVVINNNDSCDFNNNVILVNDYRDNNINPNIQIVNSFKITDRVERQEIIDLLLEYNNENPTSTIWVRSRESMMIEWDAHNDIYYFKNNERCQHVDLDNKDEGVSYIEFWWRAAWSTIANTNK